MVIVSSDKMETSSVIPVIGGSSGTVVSGGKNVMEEDPSILQVKQEEIGMQESPFLRIMGWLSCLLYHTHVLFHRTMPYHVLTCYFCISLFSKEHINKEKGQVKKVRVTCSVFP
jgi:hypothetical protein